MVETRIIPAGGIKYLTVDVTTLRANQASYANSQGGRGGKYEPKPCCWIQVGADKQNKINCWRVVVNGPSSMEYGAPEVCGAMVYMKTEAELEYDV